ncbi:MAG: [FeFe] hydrogenase H-cluster maturation GTPase HydF [Bacteroidales bacterium]|nr:[FeFe] hydrogenase H-cluster maturation GTPase HydF [Bacteroidales bacterium]
MQTPRSNRLHIALFGKRNSGKSSLINALTGQQTALVSAVAGTTTDPVYKPMELHGIGPCVFIDTAGFDDEGELGRQRVEKTRHALQQAEMAIMVCTGTDIGPERAWADELRRRGTPVVWVLNKTDELARPEESARAIEEQVGERPLLASARNGAGVEDIRRALIERQPDPEAAPSLLGRLVERGDTVVLVMPQDLQAPKGRLILPQVQTLRELLDRGCLAHCCTTDQLDALLATLNRPPRLIITDSQVFRTVYDHKPAESRLTSFSVLFAQYKGDIQAFVEGAAAIDRLTEHSRVLIAEACTHAPLTEDIGREKIPALLRKRTGPGLQVDVTAGADFPDDLRPYDLVIHCGACMFNRKYVLHRIQAAREQQVPITNYGIAIAHLMGILDKIDY